MTSATPAPEKRISQLVSVGIALIWFSACLNILMAILHAKDPIFESGVHMVGACSGTLILLKIGQRKNWARRVFCIVIGLALFLVPPLLFSPSVGLFARSKTILEFMQRLASVGVLCYSIWLAWYLLQSPVRVYFTQAPKHAMRVVGVTLLGSLCLLAGFAVLGFEALFHTVAGVLKPKRGEEVSAPKPVWEQLSGIAAQLYADGKYAEAVEISKEALRATDYARGPEASETAQALVFCALMHDAEGETTIADALYDHALALEAKTGVKVAESLEEMSMWWYFTKRDAQREPMLRRALIIKKRALGAEHVEVGRTLHLLGALYADMGRYDEAELYFKQALEILQQTLGADHPDVTTARDNIAWVDELRHKQESQPK